MELSRALKHKQSAHRPHRHCRNKLALPLSSYPLGVSSDISNRCNESGLEQGGKGAWPNIEHQ